ncbi:MAG TPA: hypothetical protein VMI30_13940 [Stellaceae bacterium]|nr:hypothetical protein [Stellaceae bacterium]
MTLGEAGEVFAYWVENPPVHLMVQVIARMLGWKPGARSSPTLDDVAAMAPPGLAIIASGEIGMPAPVLDIEALKARNSARLAKRGADCSLRRE